MLFVVFALLLCFVFQNSTKLPPRDSLCPLQPRTPSIAALSKDACQKRGPYIYNARAKPADDKQSQYRPGGSRVILTQFDLNEEHDHMRGLTMSHTVNFEPSGKKTPDDDDDDG